MENTSVVRYEFRVDPELMPDFYPLLRQGFYQEIGLGSTLQEILQGDLQIPEDYIQTRLQTIFLDNQPVDDLQVTVHTDRSSLSLSAAMPGLIGACFRRQGYYSRMRDSISYGSKASAGREQKRGLLKVKLYNFPARELGPGLLQRGLLLSGDALAGFLQNGLSEKAWKGVFKVKRDNACVASEALADIVGQVEPGWVELRVVPRSCS
ncbi:MAG: hypothetical protein K9K79_12760 [Desulfohalobiaceae bacterium]|nr:hypothetical protein [Desulfohalobiaceae bacterium]